MNRLDVEIERSKVKVTVTPDAPFWWRQGDRHFAVEDHLVSARFGIAATGAFLAVFHKLLRFLVMSSIFSISFVVFLLVLFACATILCGE